MIRKIVAFPAGICAYIIGLFAGNLLGALSVAIAILPPSADRNMVGYTGAAILSNGFAHALFSKIYPNSESAHTPIITFAALLILISIIVFSFYVTPGTFQLLWTLLASVGLNVLAIYLEIKESKAKIAENKK